MTPPARSAAPLAAALTLALAPAGVHAAEVTYAFTGTLDSLLQSGGPAPGDAFTGTIRFDPADLNPDFDPISGAIEVLVGGESFTHESDFFYGFLDPGSGEFSLGADTGAGLFPTRAGNVVPTNFGFSLFDADGSANLGSELPASFDLAEYEEATLSVFGTHAATGGPIALGGDLSRLALVPEPASAGVLLAGAALGLLRRRR